MESEPTSGAGSSARERARFALFVATGLALPFAAFPIARPAGKAVDLATACAGLFVMSSLSALRRTDERVRALAAAAAFAPLVYFLPPRPAPFDGLAFAWSYGHWLFVVAFFVCASTLARPRPDWMKWMSVHLVMGGAVASFALYQVVGIPRHWPATGRLLAAFQRQPFRFMTLASGYVRPTSVFLEPAWLGGYLAWVAALGAAVLLAGTGQRKWIALAFGLIVLALLATVSWSAYVNAAVALAATLWAGRAEVRSGGGRRTLLAVLLAGLVLIAVTGTGQRVTRAIAARGALLLETRLSEERIDLKAKNSMTVRLMGLRHTAELFGQHPVGGIGFGQLPGHAPAGEPRHSLFADAWCGWVAIGAHAGLPGMLVLAAAVLLVGGRVRNAETGAPRIAAAALLAVTVVAQFHTSSYIDLCWWYPLAAACAMGAPAAAAAPVPVSLSGRRKDTGETE